MDVNETLAQLRLLALPLSLRGDCPDCDRMAELFEALDQWIMSGGFLPHDWARAHSSH
jgi:hypothetical protein